MKIKKLNQFGFDHVFMAVFVVAAVAIIGVGAVVATHAATTQPLIAFKLNGTNSCLQYAQLSVCAASNKEVVYYKPVANSTNFELKDEAGYCLVDSSSKYQSKPLYQNGVKQPGVMRYFPILTTCNTKNKNQLWNWEGTGRHELANAATNNQGCLNAAGASSKIGTQVIIYKCNGQWNENWYEAGTTAPTNGI